MAAVFRATFSDAFSWIKAILFLVQISLAFVPGGPVSNNPALVQIMAWLLTDDKYLMGMLLKSSCPKPHCPSHKYIKTIQQTKNVCVYMIIFQPKQNGCLTDHRSALDKVMTWHRKGEFYIIASEWSPLLKLSYVWNIAEECFHQCPLNMTNSFAISIATHRRPQWQSNSRHVRTVSQSMITRLCFYQTGSA